jgi:integrase
MLFYFRFTFASTLRGCPIPITDPHQSCGLKGLRFHDLRHQCITELLEGGAPEAAVLSMLGTSRER